MVRKRALKTFDEIAVKIGLEALERETKRRSAAFERLLVKDCPLRLDKDGLYRMRLVVAERSHRERQGRTAPC